MSQNKKNRSNPKVAGKSESTPPRRGKGWIVKPVLGVLFLGLLLVGLIHFSTPKNNLEPYDKFKEDLTAQTAANDESSKDKDPISVVRDEIDEDLIKPVVDMASTNPSTLSRESIQHLAKGMKLVEQGKYGGAEREFEQAAELSPDSPEVFSIWGTALRMEKKYEGANKRFAKAYELSPKDEEITFNWGMLRLEAKEHDQAIELFKKTIKLNPDHYMAYNYMGKSYGRKKMLVEETKNYVKALEIKPDFAQAHFNLGVVLSLQKKFEAATPHFLKAIELDKNFELPFVIQFLKAQGVYKSDQEKAEAKAEAAKAKKEKEKEVKTAKLEPTPAEQAKAAKSEGSGHKMEGSGAKGDKDFTNVTGKLIVNGQPLGDGIGVVFVEPKDKMRVPDQKVQQVSIRQRDLKFLPKHTVVQVGSTVTFVNEDKEVHNIYSKSLNNQFNLGAMAAGSSKAIQFSSAGPALQSAQGYDRHLVRRAQRLLHAPGLVGEFLVFQPEKQGIPHAGLASALSPGGSAEQRAFPRSKRHRPSDGHPGEIRFPTGGHQ
ncbi:MAG: tetratricopeptide repeat protein [Nitrospinales bacterium]